MLSYTEFSDICRQNTHNNINNALRYTAHILPKILKPSFTDNGSVNVDWKLKQVHW